MMKKLNLLLLSLGLGFLGYLLWKIGPGELWQQIKALGWGITLLIGMEGLGNLAHTVGWWYCISEPRPRTGGVRLFCMAMAGYAMNYLTPSASVGGDVSRAALLASNHEGSKAVSSVMLDKLMTALAHLLLVVLGSVFIFWRASLPRELWIAIALTTILLASAMTVFLLIQKYGQLGACCRWLVAHRLGGRFVNKAAQELTAVDQSLKQFYHEHPRQVLLSLAWHTLGHSAVIGEAWLFLKLLHQPAPWSTVVAAGILSLWFDLLTFVVPMNLGTLEGSRIIVFRALGCQALLGMAFGVAVRLAQMFWACFGLVSYAFLASSNSASGSKKARLSTAAASPKTTDLSCLITQSMTPTRKAK